MFQNSVTPVTRPPTPGRVATPGPAPHNTPPENRSDTPDTGPFCTDKQGRGYAAHHKRLPSKTGTRSGTLTQ